VITKHRDLVTGHRNSDLRTESANRTSLADAIDTSANPAAQAERDEGLKFATRLLLEKVSPTERAAYVLREAFNLPTARLQTSFA
jgi:hypothetical protein